MKNKKNNIVRIELNPKGGLIPELGVDGEKEFGDFLDNGVIGLRFYTYPYYPGLLIETDWIIMGIPSTGGKITPDVGCFTLIPLQSYNVPYDKITIFEVNRSWVVWFGGSGDKSFKLI